MWQEEFPCGVNIGKTGRKELDTFSISTAKNTIGQNRHSKQTVMLFADGL